MSYRVSRDRLVTHRRQRRPPAEQFIYEQVRAVAAVPAVIFAVFFCVAVVAWRVFAAPPGVLLICVGCGVLAAMGVGLWRAHVTAGAVCRERVLTAERLVSAVGSAGTCVRWTAEELRSGNKPPVPLSPAAVQDSDPFSRVDHALARFTIVAVERVIAAHERSQLAVLHEMFRHIAKREHTLVSRLLDGLEELQNDIKSASLLNRIFGIDNLAVRLKRLVESLAILGGESASAVRHPVTVTNILRGAVQEIKQYERARVVTSSHNAVLALPGYAAPDVTHLLAELVENAANFSDPATTVYLRAQLVSAGLAIEIVDRALPMPNDVRDRMNAMLAEPERVDVSAQLEDGRIGLLVVGLTAKRHSIRVTLTPNPAGGTTALIVIPQRLLVQAEPDPVLKAAQTASPGRAALAPTSVPSPSVSTPGGLPRRQRQSAPEPSRAGDPGRSRQQLPVRKRTIPERRSPGAVVSTTPVTTTNPGLAGAFREGAQRSDKEDPSVPAND